MPIAIDDFIQLKNLYVFHDAGHPIKNKNPNGPMINDVSPQEPDSHLGVNCLYKNLNLALSFSGGFIVDKDFIRRWIASMGYRPFWKFDEVHELIFQQGKLVSAIDKSQLAKTIRQQYLVKDLLGRPSLSKEQAVLEGIRQSFSLNYEI